MLALFHRVCCHPRALACAITVLAATLSACTGPQAMPPCADVDTIVVTPRGIPTNVEWGNLEDIHFTLLLWTRPDIGARDSALVSFRPSPWASMGVDTAISVIGLLEFQGVFVRSAWLARNGSLLFITHIPDTRTEIKRGCVYPAYARQMFHWVEESGLWCSQSSFRPDLLYTPHADNMAFWLVRNGAQRRIVVPAAIWGLDSGLPPPELWALEVVFRRLLRDTMNWEAVWDSTVWISDTSAGGVLE